MKKHWVDISVPLKSGMVHWPHDPPVQITRALAMDRGDACNVSTLSMGSHTGTHMDAPFHFLAKAPGIDRMPMETTLGPARVIEIRDRQSIKTAELKVHGIRRGERILFKTLNSRRCWKKGTFVEDFVYLSTEAAEYLAGKKIRTVGVDYLSVGGFREDGAQTHRILLRAGIWIIEGLDLSKVKPGTYQLVCLPLKMASGDGAPARAILSGRQVRAAGGGLTKSARAVLGTDRLGKKEK